MCAEFRRCLCRGLWPLITEMDLRWPKVRTLQSAQHLLGINLGGNGPPPSSHPSQILFPGRTAGQYEPSGQQPAVSYRYLVGQQKPYHHSQPEVLTNIMCSVMKRRMCLGSAENIPLYSFSTSFWTNWEMLASEGAAAASAFG